jgi:hypothetical protein
MAAGKWKLYDLAKFRQGNLTLDLSSTTLWNIALFSSASNANTLSVGTNVYGDLTNELATANGYTLGGQTLTGVSFTNSAGVETFTSANPVWTASGGSITARFAVIYKNSTVNSIVKPLLCVCLLDTAPADVTATSGNTFTVTMNASGIFTISGANVD